jgi:ABC-type multidrug transport system ATPase subunit
LNFLSWQLPVLAFCAYFIYFHLENAFWYFILPVPFYLLALYFIRELSHQISGGGRKGVKWLGRAGYLMYSLFFWFYPAWSLILFHIKFGLPVMIVLAAIIWYLAILIKVTSDKIYKNNVDINRVKGAFKRIRKAFYRLVLIIPVIGRKKVPFKAVKSVSIDIENGMFGLLGPNGAGKSTLMRIICGILEQSYGQITINGIDVRQKREELQGLIGYLPQEFGMYENMTASDFLHYMGILKKLYNNEEREQRVQYVLKAVQMLDNKNDKIGSFSGGMKQRIGIAQVLMHLPRILIVDEPTAGLDPRERIRFRNLLVELSKERIVIFSTHIIEDVASSCNRVAVMKAGEVKYLGAPIHMVSIAEGKVWVLNVSLDEFENLKQKTVIVHHMRDGDLIRLRCIADRSPMEGAVLAQANLEDAYLCLLNQEN